MHGIASCKSTILAKIAVSSMCTVVTVVLPVVNVFLEAASFCGNGFCFEASVLMARDALLYYMPYPTCRLGRCYIHSRFGFSAYLSAKI